MPLYEHKCKDCGEKFEIRAEMKDSNNKVKCPSCRSENTGRVFSFFGKLAGGGSCAPSPKRKFG
jgi:putative FmdB family regulatory protein